MIFLLFLFSCSFGLAAEDLSNDFTEGQELYRADADHGAILLFERFLLLNPDDVRADDALWYLGRLYRNIGEFSTSEKLFRTVLADEESNRRTEAFYDLTKLLDNQDREEEILKLVPTVFPVDAYDSYVLKSLPVVLKSYSLVGARYRKAGLGVYPLSLWTEAVELISLYDNSELENDDAEMLTRNRVKFLIKIAALAPKALEFSGYSSAAGRAFAEYAAAFPEEADKIQGLRQDIDDLDKVYSDLDMKVAVLAIYNGMISLPGLFADVGVGGDLELKRNLRVGWKLDYRHDSFDFKTFNFNDLKTGDERKFDVSDRFTGDLKLDIGSKYFLLNRFVTSSDVTLTEDPGDFNYGGDFSWNLSQTIGRAGVLSIDNRFSVSVFPDYLNEGREISNYKVSTSPGFTFIFLPGLNLGFSYGFDYKYYPNAHYDTVDKTVEDPDTRWYYIHAAEAVLNMSPAEWLDLGLDYNFTYLDSVNYDLWLYGYPADRFVADLYDYYRNSIGIDVEIDISIYSGDLSAGYSIRRFINYPARTSAKVFTGELRSDTEIFVKMENRFELIKSANAGTFSFAMDGFLNRVRSNHTYEISYVTNYFNWEVSLGVEWVY